MKISRRDFLAATASAVVVSAAGFPAVAAPRPYVSPVIRAPRILSHPKGFFASFDELGGFRTNIPEGWTLKVGDRTIQSVAVPVEDWEGNFDGVEISR